MALWVLQFLGGLASAPVYALLAVYVEKVLHQPPLYTAFLKSIPLAVGGLASPAAGALADRIGYKPAYLWGMTSTVAGCAVFLTGQPALLGLLCLYTGVVGSLQTTAGQAYLMEATGRGRLGSASAGYFLGYTLGTALGGGAAGRIAGSAGFTTLGVGSTLLAAALIGGGLFALPRLEHRSPKARPEASSVHGRGELLARRDVQLLLAIRFLPTCYWGAVTLLVPLLLFRLTHREAAAGDYAGVSLILASLCQIYTGRICDRAGLRLPVLMPPIGITLSAVGLAIGARSEAALWGFGILGACSAWSLSITMPSLIDRAARPGERGRLVGLTALAWSAGMLTGHLAGGNLAGGRLGAAHPGLPFALAALCGLGAIVLSKAIVQRLEPLRQPE
jgi:MFS family permease